MIQCYFQCVFNELIELDLGLHYIFISIYFLFSSL